MNDVPVKIQVIFISALYCIIKSIGCFIEMEHFAFILHTMRDFQSNFDAKKEIILERVNMPLEKKAG